VPRDDIAGFEHPQHVAADTEPGVVVEQVEDLHLGSVGERPVGNVELPAFVGLLGGEPQVAALRPLVRLRGDEAAGGQDPPDRGDRRRRPELLLEVERDRRRAGVMTAAVEFLADPDDLVLDRHGGPLRAAQRPAGPRLQTGVALGQVALDQGDHPAPGHPVLAGYCALAPSFDQDGCNHQLRHAHRSPLGSGCERCPETGVNDVLNSDTTRVPVCDYRWLMSDSWVMET
jgi:hypothetical protein